MQPVRLAEGQPFNLNALKVKIADFDFGISPLEPAYFIACSVTQTVDHGTKRNYAYSAPEVCFGAGYDCKADIWSLGVAVVIEFSNWR
jgi:serine/threonine protein kinase